MQIIQNEAKEREVIDYDFLFATGQKVPVVLSPSEGDEFQETKDSFLFRIKDKKGIIPELDVCSQEIRVFKTDLAVLAIRKRMQRLPTEEEIFEMRKEYLEVAKMIM